MSPPSPELEARLREILDAGGGEPLDPAGASRFLRLLTFESAARWGLDHDARWILVHEGGQPPTRYAPEVAYLFHESPILLISIISYFDNYIH